MLNRFQDVFKSFQHHDVKYIVIGGVAAILHGVPTIPTSPPTCPFGRSRAFALYLAIV